MLITINTDKKVIEVPNDIKELYENQVKLNKRLGKDNVSVLDLLDNIAEYKVVSKQVRTKVDKTNAKTIDDFMKGVKDSNKALYDEYKALKDKVVSVSKNGKEVKTNFLVIKKWFYTNFPEQNPLKK